MDGKWLVGRLVVVVGDDSPLLFGSLWWGPPLCCCRVTDGAPDWSHHHQTHTGSALSSSGQTFLLKGSQPENFDKFFFLLLLLTVTDVIGITLKTFFLFLFPVDFFLGPLGIGHFY